VGTLAFSFSFCSANWLSKKQSQKVKSPSVYAVVISMRTEVKVLQHNRLDANSLFQ